MNSGGAADWRSRGNREPIPKPMSQTWPLLSSIMTFAGLRSLWMRPRPSQLSDRDSKADRNPQELSHVHRCSDPLSKRLAPGIIEAKNGSPLVLRDLEWRDC